MSYSIIIADEYSNLYEKLQWWGRTYKKEKQINENFPDWLNPLITLFSPFIKNKWGKFNPFLAIVTVESTAILKWQLPRN